MPSPAKESAAKHERVLRRLLACSVNENLRNVSVGEAMKAAGLIARGSDTATGRRTSPTPLERGCTR
jgi:hypothetical protein